MKKLISIAVILFIMCGCVVGCSSGKPSDKEVTELAQKAIDIVLLYTNNTPAEVVKDEFPGIAVTSDAENLPEAMGYITDLEYSEFCDKYGKVFDDGTLDVFVKYLAAESDGYLCLTGWELEEIAKVSGVKVAFEREESDGFVYILVFDKEDVVHGQVSQCEYEIKIVRTDDGLRFSGQEIVMDLFQNAYT